MRINFVMSNNVESGIFNAITQYFYDFLPDDIELYVSETPINGIDIYHYHRPNLEASLLENSVVTIHHDLDDNDLWFILDQYIDRYKEAHTIICLNTTQQQILAEHGLKNTVVIPHGYNNKLFTKKKLKKFNKDNKIKLAIISKRYGRRVKGEAYIYELMKRIDCNRFSFILVGDGRQEDYEIATSLGFDAKVYENMPYPLLNKVYEETDFLLMTSLFEGGPANIPEAHATATPILSMKIAMPADSITDGVNGKFLSGDLFNDIDIFEDIATNKGNIYNQLQLGAADNISAITWQESITENADVYREVFKNLDSKEESNIEIIQDKKMVI